VSVAPGEYAVALISAGPKQDARYVPLDRSFDGSKLGAVVFDLRL